MTTHPAPPLVPTVAFTTRYGSTSRIAHALAARLGTTPVDLTTSPLPGGTPLVVLAPIYASSPFRRKAVVAALTSATGPAAVGLVGISPPDDDERARTADRLRSAVGGRSPLEVFQLRGVYDPDRLGLLHRVMMLVAKRRLRGSDESASRAIRADEKVDLTDESALDPIVDWARRASSTPR